jgi:1,4-alpha-glucan branching enzyme
VDDVGLPWALLADARHQGVQSLVRDLNALYRSQPALYESDCFPEGFAWIDCHDSDNSIISYIRKSKDNKDFVVVVCNFTPVVREDYRFGVPKDGPYAELLNTDAVCYGGSGVGNAGRVDAQPLPSHGHPFSLALNVPPLGAVVLRPFPPEPPAIIEGEAETVATDEVLTPEAGATTSTVAATVTETNAGVSDGREPDRSR